MGRTKGSLNKSTIEKQKMATTNEVIKNKEEECVMAKSEVSKNSEEFNPQSYVQYYEDGTPYLPLKVQLKWFREKYPNGKIDITEPHLTVERTPDIYTATALVYAENADGVDNFLSKASAKRGPVVKITGTDVDLDPYVEAQRAALSMALRLAGFWCELTDEDLTKVVVKETTTEAATVATVTEPVVEATKSTEAEVVADEAVTEPVVEATESAEAEVVADEAVTEPVVEATESAEAEVVADEAVTEPVVETTEPAEAESVAEDITAVSEPIVETTETESVTEVTEPVVEDTTTEAEPVVEATTTEPTTTETATVELSEEEKAAIETELAELRAIPFNNGYYNGSIGDLETKKLEGNDLAVNLYDWLMNSNIAKKKHATQVAAVNRLTELAHPEWKKSAE